MDGDELHRIAMDRAEELPGSELEYPFGPDWDVYKVRDRIFMLVTELAGSAIVTLKADPDDARALREDHEEITPGYHMNKRHWVTVSPGPSLDEDLVLELVTDSYLRVVEKLPRTKRPVDPATFGRPPR